MGLFLSFLAIAQDDDTEETPVSGLGNKPNQITQSNGTSSTETFKESINRISSSKRIFLISNTAQKLDQGDFISIVNEDEIICRGLVARNKDQTSAIKILKIYSMKRWKGLYPGLQITIVKGDDSYYLNKKASTTADKTAKEAASPSAEGNIVTEEDLFKVKEEDGVSEKESRAIKTDNIFGATFGQFSSINSSGENQKYPEWAIQWSYQLFDNVWGEFSYGQTTMKSFPSSDLDTAVTAYTFRGKYTIIGPMLIYFMPYIGMGITKASCPNAGVQKSDPNNPSTQSDLKREVDLVSQVQQNKVIFGVSLYKRLVPGWFLKAELGSDIIALGFSLEF